MKSLIGCLLGFVNAVNREMCAYYFLKIHKELVYSMGAFVEIIQWEECL